MLLRLFQRVLQLFAGCAREPDVLHQNRYQVQHSHSNEIERVCRVLSHRRKFKAGFRDKDHRQERLESEGHQSIEAKDQSEAFLLKVSSNFGTET